MRVIEYRKLICLARQECRAIRDCTTVADKVRFVEKIKGTVSELENAGCLTAKLEDVEDASSVILAAKEMITEAFSGTQFSWQFKHPGFGWIGGDAVDNEEWYFSQQLMKDRASHCSYESRILTRNGSGGAPVVV